jgi:hypothetical protein
VVAGLVGGVAGGIAGTIGGQAASDAIWRAGRAAVDYIIGNTPDDGAHERPLTVTVRTYSDPAMQQMAADLRAAGVSEADTNRVLGLVADQVIVARQTDPNATPQSVLDRMLSDVSNTANAVNSGRVDGDATIEASRTSEGGTDVRIVGSGGAAVDVTLDANQGVVRATQTATNGDVSATSFGPNDSVAATATNNAAGGATTRVLQQEFAKGALFGSVADFGRQNNVLVEKEARFGLRRIGLPDSVIERFVSTPQTGIVDEYYIPQKHPGELADYSTCQPIGALPGDPYIPTVKACEAWLESGVFISCMAEALPYSNEPTHAHYWPHCRAAFDDHRLSAFVIVRFERPNLREWRRIISDSQAFLGNFAK